jgi:uncharacterized lipoprotein YddW (UPF0748 family)
MPAEGGYDAYTRHAYQKAFQGAALPDNPKDKGFLRWRADHLSTYAAKIYQTVKKVKPDCIVSWAPSIYPWSLEEYLQDWPTWLKGGYADLVIPQLYRYNIEAYTTILKQLRSQVPDSLLNKVVPGILTSLGDGYQADAVLMEKMIQLNRSLGFNGEVFFYFETLNRVSSSIYKD